MTDTKQARLPKRSTTIDDLPKVLLSKIAQSVVDRRALRLASKNFSQTLEDLECVDAKELQGMRKEPEPCKNTAKVIFNPEKGMQRAIMCAIMSPDNKLHVYVDQDDLAKPEFSESVKCFDQHYALELTLLYPRAQQEPPPRPGELRCADGFRALKGGLASDGALQDQRGVQVVRFTGNTHVAENAFRENESLMELLDVNAIEDINPRAFQYCSLLTQLGDLSSLTTIGEEAFVGTPLTQLGDLPSLKTIGESAFFFTQLEQLGDMPALTTIGKCAFYNIPLTQLGDMGRLTDIGDHAFYLTPLAHLGDLSSLKTVGVLAFYGTSLQQLGDLSSLQTIGDSAFQGTPLEQLGDLSSLKKIGNSAFANTSLAQLGDMKALTDIGESAFEHTPLEKLGGLSSLKTIGRNAFLDTKLEQLGDMKALTDIGESAFEHTPLEKLGNLSSLKTIGRNAFLGTPLTQLGNLSSLKTIGDFAFSWTQIKQLGDMRNLTTIGENAFFGTPLKIVHLPNTLKTVGEDAFENCPLGDLTVQPGANFECRCANLANRLRQLNGISVTGGPSYKIQTTQQF